ncbi:protein FAM107B [Myripristis murdjan]|uniref:protein FAM107B n=1 Tax=Myripristis murdjan TaxID=586833 RepID=UPI001176265C|nr:protein FAM107B-like [Myripristis murdjan]
MGLCSYVSWRHHYRIVSSCWLTENLQQKDDDLIKPKKLPNPVLESHQHRALHRELLFCCRRGLLPRQKPELLNVLEHRQRQQQKQRERALRTPSDLELKLRKRQQKIQVYELEELKRNEKLRNQPEFVRVRGSLKHIQIVHQ